MHACRPTLILAAHGSSHPRARDTLEAFARLVRARHPGTSVFLAYTATPRPGNHPERKTGPGLTEVLESLPGLTGTTGGTDLRVLSLHVIAGDEYERALETLRRFAAKAWLDGQDAAARRAGTGVAADEGPVRPSSGTSAAASGRIGSAGVSGPDVAPSGQPGSAGVPDPFAAASGRLRSLAVSGPLLSGPGDAPAVARALARALAPDGSGEAGSQAVVLMGHGAANGAQRLYRALAGELSTILPMARLGVLECRDPGDPLCIRAIARDLADRGTPRVRLVPFLTVSGRHAHKDLAGDGPDSWKSVLAAHGLEALPDLAGLIERQAFIELWLDTLGPLLAE